MNLDKVRAMEPVNRLAYWISERESIRRKKEADEPKPWTDDPILQSYRFCNVRRMDDQVSAWLMGYWYYPYKGHPNMLLAVALARFINLPNALKEITDLVLDHKTPLWDSIKSRLRAYKSDGNTIFNGAYMVRGNDGMDKIECVIDYYVRPLTTVKIFPESMEKTHANIMTSYGMGSFMAGQVTADLRWAVEGTWKDKMTWAPMGPGSQRGMNWLLGQHPGHKWKQDYFLEKLVGVVARLKGELPRSITDRLEMMDYQNCLCEYDKYCRTLFGSGKPKQKYPGKE